MIQPASSGGMGIGLGPLGIRVPISTRVSLSGPFWNELCRTFLKLLWGAAGAAGGCVGDAPAGAEPAGVASGAD